MLKVKSQDNLLLERACQLCACFEIAHASKIINYFVFKLGGRVHPEDDQEPDEGSRNPTPLNLLFKTRLHLHVLNVYSNVSHLTYFTDTSHRASWAAWRL